MTEEISFDDVLPWRAHTPAAESALLAEAEDLLQYCQEENRLRQYRLGRALQGAGATGGPRAGGYMEPETGCWKKEYSEAMIDELDSYR